MTELIVTDKYDVVIGYGATGQSVVRHLKKAGVRFCVLDTRSDITIAEKFEKEFPNESIHLGRLDEQLICNANRVIISPGVSRKNEVISKAIEKGIPVVGDVEIFLQLVQKPVVGITGSNGKTTVTSLMGKVAERAGLRVAVGGNIGTPVLDLLDEHADIFILELSSFQLESVTSPKLTAACVLNVTPDHMDRYESIQEYCFSKQKIYWGAGSVVFNRDDVLTIPPQAENVSRFSFGVASQENVGSVNYWCERESGWIYRQRKQIFHRLKMKMVGDHNVLNAMAIFALAESIGINPDLVAEVLETFPGLSHRCETISEKHGVTFVNDSKGTNVGATIAAVEGLKSQYQQIILIAGGEGKGADFSELGKCIDSNVSMLITIGVDGDKISSKVTNAGVSIKKAEDMSSAVQIANSHAIEKSLVLLSPACASFDMYSGYEERGAKFASAVEAL